MELKSLPHFCHYYPFFKKNNLKQNLWKSLWRLREGGIKWGILKTVYYPFWFSLSSLVIKWGNSGLLAMHDRRNDLLLLSSIDLVWNIRSCQCMLCGHYYLSILVWPLHDHQLNVIDCRLPNRYIGWNRFSFLWHCIKFTMSTS